MKKPMLKISLFALLFVFASFAPAKGYKFDSIEGKYSITFPSEFKSEEKQGDSYRSVQTQALDSKQVYFITHTVHESEMTDPDKLAQVSLDAFAEGLESTVTKQKAWMVNKNKGIHANISSEKNDLICEYKIILIGQIQYQIAVVSGSDSWNQSNADKFFKSFKIKK